MQTRTSDRPSSATELVEWAARLGSVLEANAARHDEEGTWVDESFEHLRTSGFPAAVPEELGGLGATIRQVSMAQRELARHCGPIALASSMHQHVTAFTVWRYRRGLPERRRRCAASPTRGSCWCRRGADFTRPRGTAVKADGGYRVSGQKVFASQAPAGTVMSTMFTYDDPERGRRVLNMAVPLSADGVTRSTTGAVRRRVSRG